MKIISWNVNGIRAILKKDFQKSVRQMRPDILGLQETKAQDIHLEEIKPLFPDYHIYHHAAERKGYSGTAIFSKTEPISVEYKIGKSEHDMEGRTIAAEYDDFFVVNVYVPNSGGELKRLSYRQSWDKDFHDYLKNLEKTKPVIVMGDFNVAHRDIDLARPKPNYNKSAGYMQEEIDGLDRYVQNGFLDIFRLQNPEVEKYSWWSYRANARENNVGWRIDYTFVSEILQEKVQESFILNEIEGSDHCPVGIDIG